MTTETTTPRVQQYFGHDGILCGIRAECTVTLSDGPAVLVVEHDLPIDLTDMSVSVQTPDGISRETIQWQGFSLPGEDGPVIEMGIYDLIWAINTREQPA